MNQRERQFTLEASDFELVNPNTLTCPIFRTGADAALTQKIYRTYPVFVDERTQKNEWNVRQMLMFMMNTASHLFRNAPSPDVVPLYEGKHIWHYDHRFATYANATQAQINAGRLPQTSEDQKRDPRFSILPRYWVPVEDVEVRLGGWKPGWLLGFREVTSSVVERTAIFSVLPRVGVGHKLPLLFFDGLKDRRVIACFLANVNSLVFDYITRQKIAGLSLSYFILKQLPVIHPNGYREADLSWVVPRVLELAYTAWDVKAFAEDMGHTGEPFRWNEDHRVNIRADLDAYFAHLYGLTLAELRYVLNPKDVFGEDFPSETFRVLKEKEEKECGEYRTRRLVLAAFDELSKSDRFAGEKRECTISGKMWTVGDGALR